MSMWRVRTIFSGLQGVPYVSTHYFAGEVQSAQQAATAVGVFWTTIDAQLSNLLSWVTEDAVVKIDETTGQAIDVTGTTSQSGSGGLTGDVLPPANQALVQWRTGQFVNGKELRGRTFVPGATETNSTGIVSTALRTACETAADAMIADVNSDLVIWSKTHGLYEPANSASCWREFAVLRSRRL